MLMPKMVGAMAAVATLFSSDGCNLGWAPRCAARWAGTASHIQLARTYTTMYFMTCGVAVYSPAKPDYILKSSHRGLPHTHSVQWPKVNSTPAAVMVLIVALDIVPVVIATMNAPVARAERAHMVRRAERAPVPVRVDVPEPT